MSFADVAPPAPSGGRLIVLACAALACMFVVSAIALTFVLARRSRRSKGDQHQG